MPRRAVDDDHVSTPFPMTAVSNGEWCPAGATPKQRLAAKLVAEEIETKARRLGMSRRQFLRTAAGTATAFMVLNKIHGLDSWGANAVLPVQSVHCEDPEAGKELLDRKMFVMDVQTHHIDLDGPIPTTQCFLRFNSAIQAFADLGYDVSMSELGCPEVLGQLNFVKEFFIDSATHVAVLSGLPYNGITIGPAAMAATRDLVNQLAGSERALSQAIIEPKNPEGQMTSLDTFEHQVKNLGGVALKCYTYSGNWRLDDEVVSYPMLEEAMRLGIRLVNVHKGLPAIFAPGSPEYVRTTDFPKVARDFPKLKFCAYHSGWYGAGNHPEGLDASYIEPGETEPITGRSAIEEFIRQLESMTRRERRRCYAEIGSTFAIALLEGPDTAAHLVGRLLKTLGSRNILWGTDSIWWGSPQFLIDAFKNLQIPESMREKYGYPRLSDRVKRRILGRNAARLYRVKRNERRCSIEEDQISQLQVAQGGHRVNRSLVSYGPQTMKEYLALKGYEARIEAAAAAQPRRVVA